MERKNTSEPGTPALGWRLAIWQEPRGVVDGSRSGSFTQASVPDAYDRFMLGQLFEPWAAELITRAGLKPECRVLANS